MVRHDFVGQEEREGDVNKRDFLNILYNRQRKILNNYKNPDEAKTAKDRIEAFMNGGRLAEIRALIELLENTR